MLSYEHLPGLLFPEQRCLFVAMGAHDRFHAPYLSVLVVTVLYAFGALVLRFVLGDAVPAHDVVAALPAEVLWNLLLTWPLYGLVRRLFPPSEMSDRAYEVRLLG